MRIRAAVHVHSDWSHDGSWPLSKIASFFRKAGYRCVLTSEHDESFDDDRWQCYRKACSENSTKDLLILPGIEYSDNQNIVHILVWGINPFLGKGRKIDEILLRVRELKGVAVLAHPSRKNAWQQYDESWMPLLSGIEQWNRKADGVAPSSEAQFLISKHPTLLPFVGLDFHRLNQFFPLVMALQIDGSLTEAAVIDALQEQRGAAKVLGVPINYFSIGILSGAAKGIEHFRKYLRRKVKSK